MPVTTSIRRGDPNPEKKSEVLAVTKDEPLVLSTPALHVKHKNLKKSIKIKEKLMTAVHRLLKERSFQNS